MKNLLPFLKKLGAEQLKKKAKVFTKDQVNTFLCGEDTPSLGQTRLAFLLGVFWALRAEEFAAFKFEDTQEIDESTLRVVVKSSKTDQASKGFTYFGLKEKTNIVTIFQNYKSKVKNPEPESRLFRWLANNGFGLAVLGKYFFYQLPKHIAVHLNFPDPKPTQGTGSEGQRQHG